MQIIYQSVRARGTPRVKPPPPTHKPTPTPQPQGYTMRAPGIQANLPPQRNQNMMANQNSNFAAPQPTQIVQTNK